MARFIDILIQWLKSNNEKQSNFVANRVAEILVTFTVDEFHHVPRPEDPADLGTIGFDFDDFGDSSRIQGLEWLKDTK